MFLKAIRLHQWTKNCLIFVPLIMAHQFGDMQKVILAAAGFFSFSICASATYLWNDIVDIQADRLHAQKKHRPIASGALTVQNALLLSVFLLIISFTVALAMLPLEFTAILVGYILITASYSFYLKRKLMVDVLTLGGLYTYRLVAGGIATGVVLSPWLLAFSIFLFLSLAFVKRFSELKLIGETENVKISGRGYYAGDLDLVRSLGSSSAYTSVLVLALYINSPDVARNYQTPELLWLTCPALLYWLSRVWFLADRGHMPEDPIIFAVRDRISLWLGVGIAITLALAML